MIVDEDTWHADRPVIKLLDLLIIMYSTAVDPRKLPQLNNKAAFLVGWNCGCTFMP